MRIWKIPDQVVRLAVLFIIAGTALLVARQRLVPQSFGELGHYRADAITDNVNREIRYAGWQVSQSRVAW